MPRINEEHATHQPKARLASTKYQTNVRQVWNPDTPVSSKTWLYLEKLHKISRKATQTQQLTNLTAHQLVNSKAHEPTRPSTR